MFDKIVILFLFSIRFILPILAFMIIYKCFDSMRNHIRSDRPLIMLLNKLTNEHIPVMYWENSIGRDKHSDIVLNDMTVSRDHAVLFRRAEGWVITDTGSRSGIVVNDIGVEKSIQVYVNDIIKLGSTELVLKKSEYAFDAKKSWFFDRKRAERSIYPSALLMLVNFFHLLAALEVCFANGNFNFNPLVPFGILTFSAWVFFVFTRLVFKRNSFELETFAVFFSGIGIITLSGVNIKDTYIQLIAIGLGMVLFCFIIKFIENPDVVMKYRLFISVAAIVLLVLNILLGSVRHGSQNWIIIGPVSIQPSEIVKIALIFVGASTLDKLQTAKNLTEFIVFTAICLGALFLIGDFGTACIFFITFLIISFMRSGSIRTVILSCSAAALGAFIIVKFKPYITNRFAAWGHAWEYADTLGYQQTRVLTYSASGGLFGVGIGKGNLKYIFASTSDLIFGMLCEEWGLILAVAVAISIAALAIYARAVSTRSRSTFYSIASCSAAGLLIFQACLNIFGATDILPLTGVTLPFISLGGSSMVSVWGMLAFIKASDERTYAERRFSE